MGEERQSTPDPMKRQTRRDFLKTGAVVATGTAAGCAPGGQVAEKPVAKETAPPTVLGANERLTAGFIGIGIQGLNAHIDNVVKFGTEQNVVGAAACDVWRLRAERGAEALGVDASNAFTDYRRVLERDDIDVVFIATCDQNHARVALDALDAGKHVYLEKAMTRYLQEAFDLYDKVNETGLVFQLGSQYTTDAKWRKAAELVQSGLIGAPVLAQASYARNKPAGEWNYELDPALKEEDVDWDLWLGPVSDRPFSPELFFRWKKYYPYCAGIISNLLSHRVAPILMASGNPQFPTRVACLGSKKITPDRDVPDQTEAIAEFPSGLSLIVMGSTVNEQGLNNVFRGHEATIYLAGNSVELRPERPFADLADRKIFDDLQPGPSVPHHHANFFEAIRRGIEPNCNIDLAIKTQTVICLAEMSERLGEMMHFGAESRTITTGSGRKIAPITYGTLELS